MLALRPVRAEAIDFKDLAEFQPVLAEVGLPRKYIKSASFICARLSQRIQVPGPPDNFSVRAN